MKNNSEGRGKEHEKSEKRRSMDEAKNKDKDYAGEGEEKDDLETKEDE